MVTYSGAAMRRERTYRAIADPIRRTILDELRASPRTVNELARQFPVSRPAVSKHLRLLRAASLVQEEKIGRQRVYRLSPQPLAEVDQWLARYRMFWAARLMDLKEYVESKNKPGKDKPSQA